MWVHTYLTIGEKIVKWEAYAISVDKDCEVL